MADQTLVKPRRSQTLFLRQENSDPQFVEDLHWDWMRWSTFDYRTADNLLLVKQNDLAFIEPDGKVFGLHPFAAPRLTVEQGLRVLSASGLRVRGQTASLPTKDLFKLHEAGCVSVGWRTTPTYRISLFLSASGLYDNLDPSKLPVMRPKFGLLDTVTGALWLLAFLEFHARHRLLPTLTGYADAATGRRYQALIDACTDLSAELPAAKQHSGGLEKSSAEELDLFHTMAIRWAGRFRHAKKQWKNSGLKKERDALGKFMPDLCTVFEEIHCQEPVGGANSPFIKFAAAFLEELGCPLKPSAIQSKFYAWRRTAKQVSR